jgi:hypothetical protein
MSSTLEGGKQINNKNILFYLDAANVKSYVGTGSTAYSLVLGTTASLLPGVTWSSDSYGVMRFNGTYSPGLQAYVKDSWITCGDRIPKLGLTFPFTLEAWVNPKKLNGSTSVVGYGVLALDSCEVFLAGNPSSYYYGVDIGLSTNNGTDTHSFSTGYYDGTGYGIDSRRSVGTSNRPVICGQWNHIVSVITGINTMQLYLNGDLMPLSALSGNGGNLTWSGGLGKTVIGKGVGYYKYLFNGDIAMVRAYNSILSVDDIKKNYNLHAIRFGLGIK